MHSFEYKKALSLIFALIFVFLCGCTLELPFLKEDTDTVSAEKGTLGYTREITLRYQYSNLTEKEKAVYDIVYDAVSNGDRFVDVKDFALSQVGCKKIIGAVNCDNPDIFWLSKDMHVVYSNGGVERIYFKYFDGETIDDYEIDEKCNVTYSAKADDEKIKARISVMRGELEKALPGLDCGDELLTEEAIHDFVASRVEYDHDAAKLSENETDSVPAEYFDSFSAYGALVNGTAVCEGYAKLFQYLCLSFGINSTQVSGYVDGEGHMWNAVVLNSDWYFTDVTFDDFADGTIPCLYGYLNVCREKLEKTHKINSETLCVPNCDSDELCYCTKRLINVAGGELSDGYAERIKETIASGKRQIVLYFPNKDLNTTVLSRILYYKSNSVQDCIIKNKKQIQNVFTVKPEYAFIILED